MPQKKIQNQTSKIKKNNEPSLHPLHIKHKCDCGNDKLHNLKCSIYYCPNCGKDYVYKNRKVVDYKMWLDNDL